jgi:hypothetical protein
VSRRGTRLRWAARAIGIVAALGWLMPLLGAVVGDDTPDDAPVAEAAGVVVLSLANVGAVALSLADERRGGRVLLVTGTLFAAFALVTAGRNQALAAGASGGPFLLAGALFVLAARHLDGRR